MNKASLPTHYPIHNTLALGKPRSGIGLHDSLQPRYRRAFKVAHGIMSRQRRICCLMVKFANQTFMQSLLA